MSKIKTFRGRLLNDTQERIYLAGGEADKGYRITKFQVMGINENTDYEATVQIFKQKQTSFSDDVNFDDDTLLGAIVYSDSTSGGEFASQTIIFDQEVVNQDLYIAASGPTLNNPMNYYIEMEEVTMSKSEQAVVNFNAALIHTE
tara:strand:- start:179 stop:613 length:435 start_codon:yes stop_codon:yes gene_type:complete